MKGDLYRQAEALMGMSDEVWRRHANPWSGYTRMFTALPLLVLAVWSRVWIGWWAVLAVGLAFAWIWLNPRIFGPPARFDGWMSRGVMGERIFIEHRDAVPDHHRRMAHILTGLSIPGAILMLWGLIVLWWEAAVFGALLAAIPKIWFVDRMVWVHDDWVRDGNAVPGFTEGA